MAALNSVRVKVRTRFVWWMKCVLHVASAVYRVTHSERLANLILLAARMQIKMEDPSGNPRSKLNTPWRWMHPSVTVKKVSA